jgi:hypothetical protein
MRGIIACMQHTCSRDALVYKHVTLTGMLHNTVHHTMLPQTVEAFWVVRLILAN